MKDIMIFMAVVLTVSLVAAVPVITSSHGGPSFEEKASMSLTANDTDVDASGSFSLSTNDISESFEWHDHYANHPSKHHSHGKHDHHKKHGRHHHSRHHNGTDCLTFPELAKAISVQIYNDLQPDLAQTLSNPNVMPDDVHDSRKATLHMKNLMDIFSPVYPKPKHGQDTWRQIRDDYDEGYETIGEFQDLAHAKINYTREDLDTLRSRVVKWYNALLEHEVERDYSQFIAEVDKHKLHAHDDSSRFFWPRDVVVASKKLSGYANVHLLLRLQLKEVKKMNSKVLDITSILKPETHEHFHDFRKAIRAILSEEEYFSPNLFQQNAANNKDLKDLLGLYVAYGNLNDVWNGYSYALRHNDAEETRKMEQLIHVTWDNLKLTQKAMEVPHLTDRLADGFVPACTLR